MMNLFENLFIFEMANNHQGDLEHGLKIIEAMAEIKDKFKIKAAVKFQFRDLDTFIHPEYKDRTDLKHIPRFMSTKIPDQYFEAMITRCKELGLMTMSTPFDEASVSKCLHNKLDFIKIASCSADDWPLLEEVADAGLPVIISTGGLPIEEIDSLVSFFRHKDVDFAILHCIALYPAGNDTLNLDFIDKLRSRYFDIPIGYSGHEAPDNTDVVKVAVAKHATILERHIGFETESIKLNAYSMNPEQTSKWIDAALSAKEICGQCVKKVDKSETESLLSLKRGVYCKKPIKKGDVIKADDVFYAMPCFDNQLTSSELGKYRTMVIASKNYSVNEAVYDHSTNEDSISSIRGWLHEARGMLYEAGIRLGHDVSVELSHHYGLEKFKEYGAIIIDVINREYCKKLIVVLPGQNHPTHFHKVKEETFHLLWGDLNIVKEAVLTELKTGDTCLVNRGEKHSFSSRNGCILEEISTTHIKNDSYYDDKKISVLDVIERKTIIESW